MDCEYHYRLTRRAEKELDDILDYIGNKLDNAKAAAKLMEDIGHCMETVCVFPEGGALVTMHSCQERSFGKRSWAIICCITVRIKNERRSGFSASSMAAGIWMRC